MNDPSTDARLAAEAKADFRSLARAGLLETSAWREFLAGYVATEEFYETRDEDRVLCSVA